MKNNLRICEFCICEFVTCADLWNVHLQNCALCRKLHLQKSVRCRFAHFVHDEFLHICRFADLRFAHLHICEFVQRSFFVMMRNVKSFFAKTRTCKFLCAHVFSSFDGFCQIWRKWRKSRNFRKCPENVRKKLTCSWVVHEWFLGQRVWQHRVAKVARICIN